jgi:hypothetical protein
LQPIVVRRRAHRRRASLARLAGSRTRPHPSDRARHRGRRHAPRGTVGEPPSC